MIDTTEFNPYFNKYIQLSSQKPLKEGLRDSMEMTTAFFNAIPKEKQGVGYKEGKWTPKEVLLHLIDTERVFMYRALQISRADHPTLEGFDQNEFAINSHANTRDMTDLLEEYRAVREASIRFFSSCSAQVLKRTGIVGEHSLSVRATGYIVSGHEKYHCQFVKDNY